MKSSRKQRAISEFGQFLTDPVLFARFMLQQDIWPKQEEILQSVAMHPRTAVKACHASGLKDDKAIAQLVGIRYFHNPRGQVVIESKEAARKRGVKSPDRAEAIILAFADIRQSGHNLMECYRATIAGEL